ncbi:gamma-glutamylcyclotransferase [[Clostridium] symbiosum]|uniref:gamma-glutamylcyclotransferase family protein n=1 Tax=Clostridium symbiosum TaxID=1512 RepID=UPI0033130257
MEKRYYIAYGSNLNVEQMRMRCPSARIIGTSLIPGYELLFKGSKTGAYLTIEKKEGGSVPVAVWETTDADEAALDRYEGCPVFYYKTEMELSVTGIRTGKTRKRKGYIYIMHEDRMVGIPGSHYISTCAAGYRFFGFDEKYLQDALQRSREDCHEK